MIKQLNKIKNIGILLNDKSEEYVESSDSGLEALVNTSSSKPDSSKKKIKKKKSKTLTVAEDSIVSTLVACDTKTELAPAIKSIFEQKKEHEILSNLSTFISNRELEIERICQNDFENFISSVDNLIAIRIGIDDLRRSIIDINKEVQTIGKDLANKLIELNQQRLIYMNIKETIEAMDTCRFTISLCKKINECIDNKRFYPAIKIIEQLQQVHLNNVIEYEFGKHLQKMIPYMIKTIKKRTLDEVSNWLLTIRNLGETIGKFAVAQTIEEIRKKEELMDLRRKGEKEYTNVIIKKRQRAASSVHYKSSPVQKNDDPKQLAEEDITEVSVFEMYNINFAPLYQSSYIHEVLGEKESFQKYYKENRKLQLKLILQQPTGQNFTSYYKQYCHAIAGFFIVEATVLQTSNDLISKSDLNSLWNIASNKLRSILQVELGYIEDKEILPEMKSFFVAYCRVFRKYGLTLSLDYI